MKTIVEMKFEIANGRILGAELITNGTCKLTIEVTTEKKEEKNTFDPYSDKDRYDSDWN